MILLLLLLDSLDGIEIVPSFENTLLNERNNRENDYYNHYSPQDGQGSSDEEKKKQKECAFQIHRISIACKENEMNK